MKSLVVLFRLKPGAGREAYEAWARDTDLPVVRGLPSVATFDLYRTEGLLGGAGPAPFDYVEVIGIRDAERFGQDVATATMRKVAAEFRTFAEDPVFMLAADVGQESGHG
jgi:hypothetical protein